MLNAPQNAHTHTIHKLHIYGFSDVVNLLGSSPGAVLHFQCGMLRYESHEI